MEDLSVNIEVGGNSVEFGVTELDNRKSKCLYRMRGAMFEPLAYFRNDQCAEEFNKIIEVLLKIGENNLKKQ